jgi:hypothetical protein
MNKKMILKLICAAFLFIVTVIFAMLDKDAVFPSTMVGFFLVFVFIVNQSSIKETDTKAAHCAITIFSELVMALNFFVTIFLPLLSDSRDLSSYSVELTTSLGTTDSKVIADHFVIENGYEENTQSNSGQMYIN